MNCTILSCTPLDSVILAGVKVKASSSRTAAVSPARAAAFDILLRVERESSYASELLHAQTYASLTRQDHGLATEIVMGVLRWRSLLDARISQTSSQPIARLDPEILTALRMAIYQLMFLRIPARAAIHESVELVKRARKRSAAPFVNAVLRKISAGFSTGAVHAPPIVGDSVATLASSSAHPSWLFERWVEAYGMGAASAICTYDQSVAATVIRFRHPEAEAQLRAEGIELAPGALLAGARRVQGGDITISNAFRSGWCVIQDEASQLAAALLGEGQNILDCCAAPGGKTLSIADRNPEAEILAVELHPHRARLLRRLLSSASPTGGKGRIYEIAADARQLPFLASFDRVLVDVPCSGTGTLSRNPEIKWNLTQKDLQELPVRQFDILRSAMSQVAAGGRLIYSTCSLEHEENEDVIERALAEDPSFRIIDCGIELENLREKGELVWPDLLSLTRGPYLRTLPGVHPCDGFFVSILQRI